MPRRDRVARLRAGPGALTCGLAGRSRRRSPTWQSIPTIVGQIGDCGGGKVDREKAHRGSRKPTDGGPRERRPIHRSPMFWVGIFLLFVAIGIYIFSEDLSWRPRRHESAGHRTTMFPAWVLTGARPSPMRFSWRREASPARCKKFNGLDNLVVPRDMASRFGTPNAGKVRPSRRRSRRCQAHAPRQRLNRELADGTITGRSP